MLTPMKRLNTNFKTLKNLLVGFDNFVLNKGKSKYIPYPFEPKDYLTGEYKSSTKGVKNDFTLIYKEIDTDVSIGFVINYLEDFDNPIFLVTIKYGGSNNNIQSSNEMSFDVFREKLNFLNKKLKKGVDNQLDTISLVFFEEKYDLKKHKENAENEVIDLIGEKYKEFNQLKTKLEEDLNILDDTKNKVESKISKLDEFKRVKELESLLIEANNKLKIKRHNIENKFNIPELEYSINEQQKIISEEGFNLVGRLTRLKKNFPIFIGDKIKEINLLSSKKEKM